MPPDHRDRPAGRRRHPDKAEELRKHAEEIGDNLDKDDADKAAEKTREVANKIDEMHRETGTGDLPRPGLRGHELSS